MTHTFTDLYMKLVTDEITQEGFVAEEKRLLDRLDAMREREEGLAEEEEETDDESDEGDGEGDGEGG